MEYVILDLEWDSIYYKSQKRFINEILQIGAVRLDKDFNIKDTLNINIRSALAKKVSTRFSKLTGITSEIMLEGIPLKEAIKQYNRFCEGAEVTMSWSNSDLYTIVENSENLIDDGTAFALNKYLDLQKLVQNTLREKGYESRNQISLEAAAQMMDIDTEQYSLHTALDDCMVSAQLFKLCFEKKLFDSLLKDATKPEFFARLKFKPYSISDINDSNIKREQMEFTCPKCSGKTVRLTPFKYRNRWFCANFRCEKCNFKFNGRVTFKKTYDEVKIKYKVCEVHASRKKPSDEAGANTK